MTMATGTIKSWDPDDGNGYIQPDAGGDDVAFDREALNDYHQDEAVREGDAVAYEVEGGPAGTMAVHVRRVTTRG